MIPIECPDAADLLFFKDRVGMIFWPSLRGSFVALAQLAVSLFGCEQLGDQRIAPTKDFKPRYIRTRDVIILRLKGCNPSISESFLLSVPSSILASWREISPKL